MESWVGMKKLAFCRWYNVGYLLQNLQKKVFNVYGAWNSPNMAPNMAQGQAFHIKN